MTVLDFKNISFTVSVGKGKNKTQKNIIQNVSGTILGGETVAIIGSSGAGKTTLLNTLAGRIKDGKLSGEISFNGKKRVRSSFKKDAAYVEQDDLLFPDLTVRETLENAAAFRLSSKEFSSSDKKARVDELLKSLRLIKSENTFIGNQNIKGISGGERKRVSIAVELITEPKMVMLDEPTSGLDSNSSEMVIQLVKNIAVERNMIAIASIHQPNFRTLCLFDKVILLAPGGVVYFGPTMQTVDYFESIGYLCPKNDNPADFFIDVMTINTENDQEYEKSTVQVENLKNEWAAYTSKHGSMYTSASSVHLPNKGSSPNTLSDNTETIFSWANSWLAEFFILLRRSWKRQLRDKGVLASYFMNALITMLIVGFVFFNKASGIVQAQNKIGLMFLIAVNVVFPVIMPILSILISEKQAMTRERASGSYRISSFFASVYFTKVPISIISNIILLSGIYFLAKFQYSATKYLIYLAIYLSAALCSLGFAFAVSSAVDSVEIASIIAPLILSIMLIFGGSMVNGDSITPVLRWLKYLSYVYFTYMAAMQNEMGGLVFDCSNSPGGACYPTGEAVIESFSLNKYTILECIMINLGMSVAYNIIAYLFLRFKSKPKYIWL
ncbi:hypothetical protein BB561_002487 [Smittium simulii]|uniref:ABC transporter domain-containing protein n=1 Tax=Smittium simulii TaxID=133385 RepID=A0A2T9YQL2_9FUNG|nr:hypothetical protein BB561_002487 [Smittium simulii]